MAALQGEVCGDSPCFDSELIADLRLWITGKALPLPSPGARNTSTYGIPPAPSAKDGRLCGRYGQPVLCA